jgi:hypothetical protein
VQYSPHQISYCCHAGTVHKPRFKKTGNLCLQAYIWWPEQHANTCNPLMGAGTAQSEWHLGYESNNRAIGIRFPSWTRDLSFLHSVQTYSGNRLVTIQWVPEILSPWVQRPGREADHSPPFTAENKNACSSASVIPYVFMKWRSVKHEDNFTFTKKDLKCFGSHNIKDFTVL